MPKLKILSNLDAKAIIDQDLVVELDANRLGVIELAPGDYLVDIVAKDLKYNCWSNIVSMEDRDVLINAKLEAKNPVLEEFRNDTSLIFRNGLAKVKIGEKYGFLDMNYVCVLPAIYDEASDFSDEGFAEVSRFGIVKHINNKGDVLIYDSRPDIQRYPDLILPSDYDWCGNLEEISRECIYPDYNWPFVSLIKNGNLGLGYLDQGHILEEVIPCSYEKVVYGAKYGFYIFLKNGHSYVFSLVDAKDSNGNYLFGERWKQIAVIPASEVVPNVVVYEGKDFILPCDGYTLFSFKIIGYFGKSPNCYYYFDSKGILDTSISYDDVFSTNEFGVKSNFWEPRNLLIIEKDQQYGLIDHDLKVVQNALFDSITYGNFWQDPRNCSVFKGWSCYIVSKDGKYGLLDLSGKMVTECVYDDISFDGTFKLKVKRDGKVGILDDSGALLVECLYDEVVIQEDYTDCYYRVKRNGKYGLMQHINECVIPCEYDNCSYCGLWNYCYCMDGEWTFVESVNKQIRHFPTFEAFASWYKAHDFCPNYGGMDNYPLPDVLLDSMK